MANLSKVKIMVCLPFALFGFLPSTAAVSADNSFACQFANKQIHETIPNSLIFSFDGLTTARVNGFIAGFDRDQIYRTRNVKDRPKRLTVSWKTAPYNWAMKKFKSGGLSINGIADSAPIDYTLTVFLKSNKASLQFNPNGLGAAFTVGGRCKKVAS